VRPSADTNWSMIPQGTCANLCSALWHRRALATGPGVVPFSWGCVCMCGFGGVRVCVCVFGGVRGWCVCVCEREREREREGGIFGGGGGLVVRSNEGATQKQ
jgi:hypothetical protein